MNVNNYTTVQHTISEQDLAQNVSLNKGCLQLRFNESQHLPWDNPHDIVSQEVEAYAHAVKDIALAFCYLIGGPANVINMAVFYKQGLQDRVNLCLFMLAVSDEVFLTSALLVHAENIYMHLGAQALKTPLNEFMANNNLLFLLGSSYISFSLSTIIACERCYCVLRPLKYQTLLSTRTMAGIIICLFLSVLSLFFIVSYRYFIRCASDPVTDTVMMMITGGEFYMNHKQLIDTLESGIFGAGLPGGLMIVMTTATIITTVKLRQIVTWRSETSSSLSAREVALTKMLVANSVFFIICISPVCFFLCAQLFFPEITAGGRYHNFFLTAAWVLETPTFANSSFNFFIYYSMGSRFRETFWTIFSKRATQ